MRCGEVQDMLIVWWRVPNLGGPECRGVSDMRVTAEAAQRFLEQERGMRDALTSALQCVPLLLCLHGLSDSPARCMVLNMNASPSALYHGWEGSEGTSV